MIGYRIRGLTNSQRYQVYRDDDKIFLKKEMAEARKKEFEEDKSVDYSIITIEIVE